MGRRSRSIREHEELDRNESPATNVRVYKPGNTGPGTPTPSKAPDVTGNGPHSRRNVQSPKRRNTPSLRRLHIRKLIRLEVI